MKGRTGIKESILRRLEEGDASLADLRQLAKEKGKDHQLVVYHIKELIKDRRILPYVIPPATRSKDIKYKLWRVDYNNATGIKNLFELMRNGDLSIRERATEEFRELWSERGPSDSELQQDKGMTLVHRILRSQVEAEEVMLGMRLTVGRRHRSHIGPPPTERLIHLIKAGVPEDFISALAYFLALRDKDGLTEAYEILQEGLFIRDPRLCTQGIIEPEVDHEHG